MRVSDYYKLGRTQPTLSFVDVKLTGDVKLFISPRAIRLLGTEWGDECVSLIQSFFRHVIELIKKRRHSQAVALLSVLKEPNETHLGLSKGRSRGRGLGRNNAKDVWEAFSKSKAAQSGLLTDLEDTVLMVDGVSTDIISDMTTNIIRAPLIRFTQEACTYHGIPMHEVDSGPLWNRHTKEWDSTYVSLPVPNNEKLILVPKEIVRSQPDYSVDRYYRHYILEYLRQIELDANSELVTVLKNGTRVVRKKALRAKYGSGKSTITEQTLANPKLLSKFKSDHSVPSRPLTHGQFARIEDTPAPDWDALLSAVVELPTGSDAASEYERNIEALLTALFYPILTNPQTQVEIHDGRKRIDITYTNMAHEGFFQWLAKHHPCGHIFIECKNYGKEIQNPELDQISGRFSPNRGKFGIIVCRQFRNRALFEQRCRDTADDHRGYVIALDDSDLKTLVKARKTDRAFFDLPLFRKRFDALVL